MLQVFGIRHHGPGSTRRLLQALDDFKPDQILIEGPIDAGTLIANPADIKPPVAIVSMDKKSHQTTGIYPFASFSPEWQAILWSWNNKAETHFIDLPSHDQRFFERSHEYDPLKKLANESGFTDTENWWEYHFEQSTASHDLFADLHKLINQLRPAEASLREQFMVQEIARRHNKNKRTAVVCGAWHAPILEKWQDHLPKEQIPYQKKSIYYWVPWTYWQLASEHGYGAGVTAPTYYDILWNYPNEVASYWFVHAAKIFRGKGLDVSPAHLIQATQLAQNLASLRSRHKPGLAELTDGIESVFPKNEKERWKTLRKEIWIGHKRGHVDPSTHRLPLIDDFYQKIKSFRLSKTIEEGQSPEKKLDIRKPRHEAMSVFFHQLKAMGLRWPNKLTGEVDHLGTFNEYWDLNIDFVLDAELIEHVHKGQSIEEAGLFQIKECITHSDRLATIIDQIELAIRAHYEKSLPELLSEAQNHAVSEEDGIQILGALVHLHQLLQFGDFRSIDVMPLKSVFYYLHEKLYIHLMHSLEEAPEEENDMILGHLKSFHQTEVWALSQWSSLLLNISQNEKIPDIYRGLCFKLYTEIQSNNPDINSLIKREFTGLMDVKKCTSWLSGFLSTGKTDFIQNTALLQVIDQWLMTLSKEQFDEVLVGLRQSFSLFSEKEKKRIWNYRNSPSDILESEANKEYEWIFMNLFKEIISS